MTEKLPDEKKKSSRPKLDQTFSNEISTATLVKLLIRKNVLSPSEILEEERETRRLKIDEHNKTHAKLQKHKHKRARFKKWASKHRWSRRLTSKLFGWEWKKVKHYQYIHSNSTVEKHIKLHTD